MKNKNFLQSFSHALEGIAHTIKNERNMRFHILASILVIIAGILFRLSFTEFAVLFFAIGLVIASEMANTMVERIIDILYKSYDENAKIIKDVAAGMVAVSALTAALVGFCLFGGRIIQWIMEHL